MQVILVFVMIGYAVENGLDILLLCKVWRDTWCCPKLKIADAVGGEIIKNGVGGVDQGG